MRSGRRDGIYPGCLRMAGSTLGWGWLLALVLGAAACGARMDAIQAHETPVFENGGYARDRAFDIFVDDLPRVSFLDYRNGAYRIELDGRTGWITRLYPYYKVDWPRWQPFIRRALRFSVERRANDLPEGNPQP